MNTSVQVDNFLQYLVDKYFVFDPKAELDESNTIDDVLILERGLGGRIKLKKITDESMIELCKNVIRTFGCYDIAVCIGDRLSEEQASIIYMHYKRYKCSSNSHTRETETSLVLDSTLKTNDTYYIESLDDITTNDLKTKFGNYICSGNPGDDFRYEYRFRFAKDNRVYKFSLYDYRNDFGEFYQEDDIYWHVASDTDKKDVTSSFIEYLNKGLNTPQDCC